MSKVYDKYRVPGEPDVWYLKLSDGSVYGPEEHAVVFRWASEGRIAPGDQISQDNITWVFAENVARMRMDWIAEMGSGKTYGPFNLLAVPNLVRHGTFRANARLVNRYTGKSLRVEEVLKPEVAAELAVQGDIVAVQEKTPNVAGPLPPVQQQPKHEEIHLKDKESRHKKHADADTEHQVEELQKRTSAAEVELAERKRELDEALRKQGELADRIKLIETEKGAAIEESRALKAELDKEKSLHTSVRSSAGEKEKALLDQIETMRGSATSMDAALQDAKKQLERRLQVERELDQRLEQFSSQAQAAQAAQKCVETELNEKTKQCDSLAKERAASEETLARQTAELCEKTTLLEKERRQRVELDAEHKEASQKLDAELQSRKTQLDKLANLLEKARSDLEKEQKERQGLVEASRRKEKELQAGLDEKAVAAEQLKQELEKEKASLAETDKKSKDKLTGLEKEIQALTLKFTESAKHTAEVKAQLDKEKEEKKSLEKSGREKEKTLQTALEEKGKALAKMEQTLQKERKEHAASIRSVKLAEEELQRDLDEKTGLLERIRRELEKEKALLADSEAKRKEAEYSVEADMRNLKAQGAGLAKLLEAAKLELNKGREEHEAFVKASLEKEEALRDEIHKGSEKHVADLEAEIATLKARTEESLRLAEQGKNDVPAMREAFGKEKEALLKQIQELESRRNHAEILVQETIQELNKHKDKYRAFTQEAQVREQALEKRIKELEKPEPAPAAKWFLKMQDGSIYGPAELAELRTWAEQCRVVPGNELSQDRQKWTPAEKIPELGMQWMIELLDKSTYGPLNGIALNELVTDGLAAPDAKVTNRVTNEQTFLDKFRTRLQSGQG